MLVCLLSRKEQARYYGEGESVYWEERWEGEGTFFLCLNQWSWAECHSSSRSNWNTCQALSIGEPLVGVWLDDGNKDKRNKIAGWLCNKDLVCSFLLCRILITVMKLSVTYKYGSVCQDFDGCIYFHTQAFHTSVAAYYVLCDFFYLFLLSHMILTWVLAWSHHNGVKNPSRNWASVHSAQLCATV